MAGIEDLNKIDRRTAFFKAISNGLGHIGYMALIRSIFCYADIQLGIIICRAAQPFQCFGINVS